MKIGYILATSILTGGLTAFSVTQLSAPAPLDIASVVRSEIQKNPQLIMDSLQAFSEQQRVEEAKKADQKAIDQKSVIGDTSKLPFIGAAEGAVEIVYFFDVNCGYCKRLDPILKKVTEDNPDVRVSHREIPILADSSRIAAVYSNILWELHPSKYPVFHNTLMSNQGGLSSEAIEGRLVAILGAIEAKKVIEIAADKSNEITKRSNEIVEANLKLMHDSGITGTPFVYVLKGDGLMRGAGEHAYNELLDLIEKARAK